MDGLCAGAATGGNTRQGIVGMSRTVYTCRMSMIVGHREFGSELRAWRTRRGVSQLDLAIRAGTTQRHLSFVEQGRSAPGRTMVVRLAESLELGLGDRNALLLAAGYAPLFPESPIDGPTLQPVREALDRILIGHEPYPAVVVRHGGEIVAMNGAVEVLFDGVDPALRSGPINAYRVALHPEGMAPRVTNLGEWGQHVLTSLRAALRRGPNDELAALVDELAAYLPPWTPGPDHIGFAVPLRLATPDGELTLITTLMSFATATDVTLAGMRLEAFLPADSVSARILHELGRARAGRP